MFRKCVDWSIVWLNFFMYYNLTLKRWLLIDISDWLIDWLIDKLIAWLILMFDYLIPIDVWLIVCLYRLGLFGVLLID